VDVADRPEGEELAVATPRCSDPTIDRASATDLMTLASDHGPVPMNIGAVLVLDHAAGLDLRAVEAVLADRVPRVPRLRQRLVRTPWGCGRPLWVDDCAFDLRRHLSETRLPAPGGTDTLLRVAAEAVCEPLDAGLPLWRARLVTGPHGDGAALVLVLHHVLADGIGGLAVLAALSDGTGSPAQAPGRVPVPARTPRPRELAVEAWRGRLNAAVHPATGLRRVVGGLRELGLADGLPRLAPATSLNRPTGSGRRLTVVEVPLPDVVAAARAGNGTVNDVVVSAVAGALAGLLRSRGESPGELVVSVPISSRRTAQPDRLGNETGVLRLTVPTVADASERLRSIVATARTRASVRGGGSAAMMCVVFRALAGLRLYQPFVDHQRLVNTFVSNVRGPAEVASFGGHRIAAVLPVAVVPGNVSVSFDVLSYAGRLTVTLVADPALVPDLDALTDLLAAELAGEVRR